MFSRSCESSGELADVGDDDPCLGGGDGALEILDQLSAPAEPRECAFNAPSTRQDFEAFVAVRFSPRFVVQ